MLGVEFELLADCERERDDAPAVLAGVAVVGFHNVPEDERCSAIRIVELEQTPQAPVSFVGEHGQERQQGQRRKGRNRGTV